MPYTTHIASSSEMLIGSASLWLYGTNAYVVAPDRGGPAVVVDAPPDPDGIASLLAEYDLTPVAALVTHGHVDHAGGIDGVVTDGVTAFLHPDDLDLARHPAEQLGALLGQIPGLDVPVVSTPFIDLHHGDILDLAGIRFEVQHTPGHTPGHCCFTLDDGVLFSGDQLFAGSIGRTDLPGGNQTQLMRSMRDRIMVLDDEVRVLPGHGPETTIGLERRTNPFRTGWQG